MNGNFNQLTQQRKDGQISKSNYSSLDNPLKYPQPYYSNNNNNNYNDNFNYNNNSNNSNSNNIDYNNINNIYQNLNNMDSQKYPLARSESVSRHNSNSNTPANRNFYPNELSTQPQSSQYNQTNQYQNTAPLDQPNLSFYQNQQNNQQMQPMYSQSNPNLNIPYSVSPRPSKKDSEIRVDMENVSKQAYRRALDQQVAEKQVNKFVQEKERKQTELAMIPQYPFGRRTNPSYLVEDYSNYQPSFNNYDPYNQSQSNLPKLDKDHIVEKPNSLSDDIPPYDPVKESKATIRNTSYDPWGRPGGGAPMIDPETGKKFTRISGQLWYDTIGLTPSARQRHKEAAARQQPLSIEEQKIEMELEQQRRKHEEAMHRSRAGDVATWIQDIEGARWPLRTHLNHTNVTREKVNLEYARRGKNDKTRVYHDELGLQLEERERQNKLLKLREDVAGIEPYEHYNI